MPVSRCVATLLVLALPLGVAACAEEQAPAPDLPTDSAEEAAPQTSEVPECVETADPSPLRLAATWPAADRALVPTDALALSLENGTDVACELTLRAEVVSKDSRVERTVTSASAAGFEVAALSVPLAALSLPTEELELSGEFSLWLTGVCGDYDLESDRVYGYYHPSSGAAGWFVYSEQARDAIYDGGALSPRTRAERSSVIESAGADEVIRYVGNVHVQKVSSDATFIPADNDAE